MMKGAVNQANAEIAMETAFETVDQGNLLLEIGEANEDAEAEPFLEQETGEDDEPAKAKKDPKGKAPKGASKDSNAAKKDKKDKPKDAKGKDKKDKGKSKDEKAKKGDDADPF